MNREEAIEILSSRDNHGMPCGYTNGYIEALDMAIEALKAQEWIPCSEGLPEYRKLVDVTTRDLRVKLAYLDSVKENGTDDLWIIPLEDAECALWNIVAWKPRPEPYREDGEA